MSQLKNKTLFNLILWFSIFALFAAYFIQYILGHLPCNLCLLERIPYFLVIIIVVISFKFKRYEKIYLALLSIIFIFATLLSFYHFGIEQGFFKESLVCNLDSQGNNLTAEDILKELSEKTISCKDITFKILGFSLATINTLISLVLSIIVAKIFYNYEKNK
jgi:disulfide bond formation protein DsbB|tara:strand:- start:64 stop:549 length:486 start_codon:yes stop_codon:yes gene_type:complete